MGEQTILPWQEAFAAWRDDAWPQTEVSEAFHAGWEARGRSLSAQPADTCEDHPCGLCDSAGRCTFACERAENVPAPARRAKYFHGSDGELILRLRTGARDLHPYSVGEVDSPRLDVSLPAYLNEAADRLTDAMEQTP